MTFTAPAAADVAGTDGVDTALVADAVRLVAEFVREHRHLRFTVHQLAAAMGEAGDAAGGTGFLSTGAC